MSKGTRPNKDITCEVAMALILRKLPLIFLTMLFCLSASAEVKNKTMNIKVRSAKIRSAPKNWAGAVTTVRYGDSVEQLSLDGGWLKVKAKNGSSGYLHESAVTSQKVILSSRAQGIDSFTDSSEVVLAGKGFNREAERQLAQSDSSLNFHAVDFLERQKVSDAELAAFIQSGKLNQQG